MRWCRQASLIYDPVRAARCCNGLAPPSRDVFGEADFDPSFRWEREMKVQSANGQINETSHAHATPGSGSGVGTVAAPAVFDTSGFKLSNVANQAGGQPLAKSALPGDPAAPAPLRLRGGGKGIPWGQPSTSGNAPGSSSSASGTSASTAQRITSLQQRISQLESQLRQLSAQEAAHDAQFPVDYARLKSAFGSQSAEESDRQWAAMTSRGRDIRDRQEAVTRELRQLRSELQQIQH
ncbi:hypothetical protein B0G83_118117 [Paraburkholderia sp. BL21I4N1]|nr:hypothetical protein B0G83_118117 [Paraburkholderia sp. BL21I4N1]